MAYAFYRERSRDLLVFNIKCTFYSIVHFFFTAAAAAASNPTAQAAQAAQAAGSGYPNAANAPPPFVLQPHEQQFMAALALAGQPLPGEFQKIFSSEEGGGKTNLC